MAKKETAEDPMSIGHHSTKGYGWGYDVLEDGKIRIAPCMADPMRTLTDRASGLEDMQEAVIRYVAQEMAALNKRRREWWIKTGDDLGVNLYEKPGWSFDPVAGVLTRNKPEPVPSTSTPTV